MKNILTLLFLSISMIGFSQNFIDRNFGQYEDLDETTVIHVTAKSFELASFVIPTNDDEERELSEFVGSIEALDLISVPELATAKTEYASGKATLDKTFEELVNVKDKGSRFALYIDQENDIVYELVGIGYDEGDFFVVSVTGAMDLDALSSVINKIDSDKLKPLKKMGSYNATDFEIYPNPVSTAAGLQVDIPENLIGGEASVIDMNGSVVKRFSITQGSHRIDTADLTPGTYVVGLEKDSVLIKKQVVVVR